MCESILSSPWQLFGAVIAAIFGYKAVVNGAKYIRDLRRYKKLVREIRRGRD